MPKWQIVPYEYLKRLNLDLPGFEKGLCLPKLEEVSKVVPMREIKKITSLIPINLAMLAFLIRSIKTLDGRYPFPNANSQTIKLVTIDPNHLKVGQKYIFREKYQNLMEDMPSIFAQFAITSGGLANLGAYFVFGYNGGRDLAMACYLPPIVENHGHSLLTMDGIHRSFISKQAGSFPLAIHITGVELPFPCSAHEWSETKIVSLSDKPAKIEERYFDLKEGLFRDLKYLGIDG